MNECELVCNIVTLLTPRGKPVPTLNLSAATKTNHAACSMGMRLLDIVDPTVAGPAWLRCRSIMQTRGIVNLHPPSDSSLVATLEDVQFTHSNGELSFDGSQALSVQYESASWRNRVRIRQREA